MSFFASYQSSKTSDSILSPLQVLLDPSREMLRNRLEARREAGTHFMPPELLDSQLAALEAPTSTRFRASLVAAVDEDYRERVPFSVVGGRSQPQWQIQKALRPAESDVVCIPTCSAHRRWRVITGCLVLLMTMKPFSTSRAHHGDAWVAHHGARHRMTRSSLAGSPRRRLTEGNWWMASPSDPNLLLMFITSFPA